MQSQLHFNIFLFTMRFRQSLRQIRTWGDFQRASSYLGANTRRLDLEIL